MDTLICALPLIALTLAAKFTRAAIAPPRAPRPDAPTPERRLRWNPGPLARLALRAALGALLALLLLALALLPWPDAWPLMAALAPHARTASHALVANVDALTIGCVALGALEGLLVRLVREVVRTPLALARALLLLVRLGALQLQLIRLRRRARAPA